MRTEHCRGAAVLERWQNGIALASKASARKGLGVRIPRAPLSEGRPLRSLGLGVFSFLEVWRGMRTCGGIVNLSEIHGETRDPWDRRPPVLGRLLPRREVRMGKN